MKMMSDDMLSQEEIEALLKGELEKGLDNSNSSVEGIPEISDILSPIEQDALGEIGNISFGSSATALSTLLNQKVEITTPNVTLVRREDLINEFPSPYVAVSVGYTVGFSGTNLLIINTSDAAVIADLMLGGDGLNPRDYMDEIQLSAVQEAMNQMMGSAATSLSTIFNKKVDISPPSIDILDLPHGEGVDTIPQNETLVKISFKLKIGNLIDSFIMQLLEPEFAKNLVSILLTKTSESTNTQPEVIQPSYTEPSVTPVYEQQVIHTPQPQPQPVGASRSVEPYMEQRQSFGNHVSRNNSDVQPAVFSQFQNTNLPESEARNLNMLLDIPLSVTVELGRTKRTVKDILELGHGSIIELDKLAGEPVDILVNNKLIAKGEVVVIEENFGVRITDIISQSDRLNNLK
jgi:flagellar motor switch protein FliN/FliY